MTTHEPLILAAAEALQNADRLFITAGAGIGVDSGLPDFRGNQGFWRQHPIYAQQKLTFADLANPMWFENQPDRAWGFYGHRYHLYQQTQPHEGFEILRQWMANMPLPGFVATSNVDGHFQKAGFPTDAIYECHGSIHFLQCLKLCRECIWPAEGIPAVDDEQLIAIGSLPRCPDCGGLARPNILMFGDAQWQSARSDMQRYAFHNWRQQAVQSKIVIVEIGAGYSVGRIRSLSQSLPGTLIRINPRDSEGPAGTISIAQPALLALKAIDQVLEKR